MRGSSARGTSNAASSSSSQSSVSKSMSCVRLAFVTSVKCTPPAAPPVRFQSSHVSIVPNSASPAAAFARAPRHVVEQPLELEAAEIRRERQARARAEAVLAAVARIRRDELGRPRVLPHERVCERRAGVAVPQHRRLALIRDADGRELAGLHAAARERLADHGFACCARSRPRRARPSPASDRSARARAARRRRSAPCWSNTMKRLLVVP